MRGLLAGETVVAGLDVGSTKTCAVVLGVGPGEDAQGRVLGVGSAPTEGVRSEDVTDMEATTASVRTSLEEAEVMADREVRSVFVGLSGGHIELESSAGVVAVSGPEIRESDLSRVHEVGRAVVIPPDREMLHAIPQQYRVDGRDGIRAPVGMSGTRLEVDVCIVSAASAACRDLRRAVSRAGWSVRELVLEPLASSLAVLREPERQAGVALVELGGASTDVAVFRDEKVRSVRSLRWGGATVTSDIVKGLGVPVDEAERLKREHGVAVTDRVEGAERIEVPGPSPDSTRSVSRELLAHIIEQRLDEIFGLVYDGLEEDGELDRLGGGIVLTGGGVALEGTVELAGRVFNLPVRVGEPGERLGGFADAVRKPKFATAVGLALYGRARREQEGTVAGRVLGRMTDWIRDFF